MVVFQAVAWEGRDIDGEYTITVYGRTKEGKSVSVSTTFDPYFYVKIPPTVTSDTLWKTLQNVNKRHEDNDPENRKFYMSYNLVKMKELWGFTNSTEFPFMKLNFKSYERMRRFAASCKYIKVGGKNLKIYESNIDPLLRFMHRTCIQSTGWLEASGNKAYLTTCDIDMICQDWRTMKPIENDSIAPFKIMSLDIECYSSTGKFPNANVPGDVLFQAAFTTRVYGCEELEQKCLCLHETDGYESYTTEKELLTAISEYIVKTDPDIITGWNIFGFDLEYIVKRMQYCKCDPDTFCMGRRRWDPCSVYEKNLSSSALGQNMLKLVPMSGRYIFDLFQTVKAEHKLESYSLNNVSLEFLGDQKNDMPIRQLFEYYESRDPVKLKEVADYCVKDTELPIQLMQKLYTVENFIEMAKATWVPMSFLSERGQQIKVFSQIAKKARELGFAIPVLPKSDEPVEYTGATVLEAQTGAYYEPITALDFASLYPSIMIAHNLCYSTLVVDPKYDNLQGVEYETHGDHRFAQNVPSLLPEILKDLKQFRKKAKADMAKSKGTHMYHIYDSKQLAYKVSMNSVYGFTGAAKGMLPCVPIASTVTCQGRNMIQMSKEYVERNFPGAVVRYGDTDSIMVQFDTDGRKGMDAIEYSWKLGEQASKEITKLFKPPNDLELEKIYCPYFLYSKKRYAAKMWVMGKNGMELEKIDIKGLQVIRRDNCAFVRDTCQQVINMLLDSSSIEAVEYAKQKADELKQGKVDSSQLVMSKRLGDSYKSNNLAHVVVRDKIKDRTPGAEPQSGDRVQFVILKNGSKKMFEKAEDPKWAQENGLGLDYEYYFKHQFEQPIMDLISPVATGFKF